MGTVKRIICVSMLFIVAVVPAGNHGFAQKAECTAITKIPAVIEKPGSYCLKTTGTSRSITVKLLSDRAISITADDVVLDLGGIELVNTANENKAAAIRADQSGITIKHGSLSGFYVGVKVGTFESSGNVVENMNIRTPAWGIDIRGKGSIVQNNAIKGTGDNAKFGILAEGALSRIINNAVSNIRHRPIDISGRGDLSDASSIVDKNKVEAKAQLPGVGILIRRAKAQVTNNSVTNMETGLRFSSDSFIQYQNNTAGTCATPYQLDEGAVVVDSGNNK